MKARPLVALAALALSSSLWSATARASDPTLPPGYGGPTRPYVSATPYQPYAPYGASPSGYGGPGQQPMVRRSPALMGVGIALTALGGAASIASLVVDLAGSQCSPGQVCTGVSSGAVFGLLIGGVVGLGVGIPLLIYGAKEVPAGSISAVTPWVGAPGGAGWQWRF